MIKDSDLYKFSSDYAERLLDLLVFHDKNFVSESNSTGEVNEGVEKVGEEVFHKSHDLVDRRTRIEDLVEEIKQEGGGSSTTANTTDNGNGEGSSEGDGSQRDMASMGAEKDREVTVFYSAAHVKSSELPPVIETLEEKLENSRERFIEEYAKVINVDSGTARGLTLFTETAVLSGFSGGFSQVEDVRVKANSMTREDFLNNPEFVKEVDNIFRSLFGDIEHIKYKSPMTFALIGHLLKGAEKQKLEVLFGTRIENLVKFFDQEKVKLEYGQVKDNLDLMNRLYFLIDPNAHNNL